MKRGPVVSGVTGHESAGDQTVIGRSPHWLAVVVGTGRAGKKPEAVVQRVETAVRVSDRAFKPTNHARADAAEDGAREPRLTQQFIQAMRPPERQQVGGVATAYV